MQNWTHKRKISLAVHTVFVAIPLIASTVAALLLWYSLFGDWFLAVGMVALVEVLAVTGLVLFIARIDSPFVHLRHAIPFISIVPLARELFVLLVKQDPWIQYTVTLVVASIFIAITWLCLRTIERLFTNPLVAAEEAAREQVANLEYTLAQLAQQRDIVDGFVRSYIQPGTYVPQPATVPLLTTLPETPETQVTHSSTVPSGSGGTSVYQQVKQSIAEGKTLEEILLGHPEWQRSTIAPYVSRAKKELSTVAYPPQN